MLFNTIPVFTPVKSSTVLPSKIISISRSLSNLVFSFIPLPGTSSALEKSINAVELVGVPMLNKSSSVNTPSNKITALDKFKSTPSLLLPKNGKGIAIVPLSTSKVSVVTGN